MAYYYESIKGFDASFDGFEVILKNDYFRSDTIETYN